MAVQVYTMNQPSLQKAIQKERERLQKENNGIMHATLQQQHTHFASKTRIFALQHLSIYVLSFITAISWERAVHSGIGRLLQGKITPWRINMLTALAVTAATIAIVPRLIRIPVS